MTGLGKYSRKMKREMRRRNHIAKDLRTPKYKQRVVDPQKEEKFNWREWEKKHEED